MKNSNSGRKQAQRSFEAKACETCGTQVTLQRHHKDRNTLNNTPGNIQILCQECHKALHVAAGDWGRGQLDTTRCEICKTEFTPKRARRSTLCGNPQCLSEKGKRSAALRWA